MNQQVSIAPIDVAKTIKQLRMLRVKIKEIEDKHKAELDPYGSLESKLEGIILKHLHDTNQKSAKTEFGSAGWYIRRSFSVLDQDEFRRHVIGSEAWELLKWAVLPAGAQEFEQKNGTLPPGVKDSKLEVLSITAPTKPKLKTATSEGEVGEAVEGETL